MRKFNKKYEYNDDISEKFVKESEEQIENTIKELKCSKKKIESRNGMDLEVVDLCNAMNALPGIKTFESCCGDGCSRFVIYFEVIDTNEGLFFLTRCVDRRYWRYGYLWKIELSVDDSLVEDVRLPITYALHSGPIVGKEAYKQAEDLVKNMNDHLNLENFLEYYNLDINKFDL